MGGQLDYKWNSWILMRSIDEYLQKPIYKTIALNILEIQFRSPQFCLHSIW